MLVELVSPFMSFLAEPRSWRDQVIAYLQLWVGRRTHA